MTWRSSASAKLLQHARTMLSFPLGALLRLGLSRTVASQYQSSTIYHIDLLLSTVTYSVALFLKRQCDLTRAAAQSRAQAKAARPAVAAEAQDDLAQATDPGAALSAVAVAVAAATGRLPMTSVVPAQFT